MKNVHTYTLQPTGVIQKDGFDTICPFAPKIPLQNGVGLDGHPKIEMMQFPCSIACPSCNVSNGEYEKKIGRFVLFTCGASATPIELQTIKKDADDTTKKGMFAVQ